jgi:hypothetical protein
VHYVVDPEVLFGDRADYLLEVVLDENDHERQWRLLVLEDTGELLAADAKEADRPGAFPPAQPRRRHRRPGVAGIGAGDDERAVAAVASRSRASGPMRARVEFAAFPSEEAGRWLAERGAVADGGQGATLANLFARVGGYEAEPERPIGFAG